MKSNTTAITVSFSIAILIAIVLWQSSFSATPASAANATQIEYKVIKLPNQFGPGSEQTLNELGAQGWDISYGFGEFIVLKRNK